MTTKIALLHIAVLESMYESGFVIFDCIVLLKATVLLCNSD